VAANLPAREQTVFGADRRAIEDQPFLGWTGKGLLAAVIIALWSWPRPGPVAGERSPGLTRAWEAHHELAYPRRFSIL